MSVTVGKRDRDEVEVSSFEVPLADPESTLISCYPFCINHFIINFRRIFILPIRAITNDATIKWGDGK